MIRLVDRPFKQSELKILARETYVELIKAAVDVEKGTFAVGGELHADILAFLAGQGSKTKDVWGFNIYFRETVAESLEFTSLINVRPPSNPSLVVKDPDTRGRILAIVERSVDWGH